jgi:hypothetical protein
VAIAARYMLAARRMAADPICRLIDCAFGSLRFPRDAVKRGCCLNDDLA